MIPQTQLHMHSPEDGIQGDCFRTCIACILDLPVASVPHFYAENTGQETVTPDQAQAIRDWFSARGEVWIEVPLWNPDQKRFMAWTAYKWPGLHMVLMGNSSRGIAHAVVIRDGKVVHDPHPEGDGVLTPDENDFYWVGFIGRNV